MRIETERLVLRSWRKEDVEAIVRYANNRNVSMHLRDRFPYPYTEKDARDFLERQTDDPPLNLAVEVVEHPGEAIGSVGLMPMADIHRFTCEVGYWLGEPFWGRGLAAEALRRFTDYAFERFPFERLEAYVSAANPASCRVLEKAGYEHEATLRRNTFKHGQFNDSFVYVRFRAR